MASQGVPVPGTTPDWDALIRILQSGETVTFYPQGTGGQGVTITTVQELLEYAKSLGYEPVYTVREVLTGFAQVSPADSTTTTDVVVRVGTQVVTDTVTGVVSEFISGGNVTLGLVTRQVATSAAMTLLINAIQAGQVSSQVQEDLITAADPYTIDGEHVVILIDEDGKVHYQKELLDAVRAKAVELGIFGDGSFTPQPAPGTGNNIPYYVWENNNTGTFTKRSASYGRAYYDNMYPYAKILPASAVKCSRDGQVYTGVYATKRNDPSVIYRPDYVQLTPRSSDGRLSMYLIFLPDNTTMPPKAYTDISIWFNGMQSAYNWVNTRLNGASITDSLNPSFYIIGNFGSPSAGDAALNGMTVPPSTNGHNSYLYYAFATQEPGGVPGIEPNLSTASDLNDLTKPLTQIIPQLAQGEMSTPSPTDDDLENTMKWYAVNTTKDNVFDEGADESDTDPDVSTNGDTSPDTEDEIEELLKDLLKHILDTANDPDSPDYDPTIPDYPTVDVQDSGDTPPAEPPLISGSANGLWKIYNPTISEIHSFGSWLWDSSIIEQITRMFSNPIDAVIALHQIYCTPVRGAGANIMCGYLDSGVQSSYTVANQYQTIDCGTVAIEEFYKTAVDYTETKIAIYLPFVGIVPLDASVVMGSQLQVIYRIDVLTGTCLAQVKVIKQNSNAVMYAFNGNCACQIPLTATTYTGMVSTLVGVGTAAISAIGGSAPGVIHGAKQAIGGLVESAGTGGIKQSGTFGANAGALGIRIPYVIITHPTIYDAYAYNEQYGYPSNLTVSLGSLSGYTRVKDVHLKDIPCTDDELEMIESLLKEGVIIN